MSKKKLRVTKNDMKLAKSLKLTQDTEIAYDFAQKVYKKINTPIKSIVLFGSSAKGESTPKSDIDIVIIVDDANIQWDEELVAWYREELSKIIKNNPYAKPIHVNTVRLTTWWNEMIRGEPVVINIIRWGLPLIDFGGFFSPLKALLAQGKIRSTPEMIYVTLGRAPAHLAKCKWAMATAVEALYWTFVDASHAALIAARVPPPSPEHISGMLKEHLVNKGMLDKKYVEWYNEVYVVAHKLMRQELTDIDGRDIQVWRERADEYIRELAIVVKRITGDKYFR